MPANSRPATVVMSGLGRCLIATIWFGCLIYDYTSGNGKKVSLQATIGQQGINLIEQIVLGMGSAWHPGNASLDAGIDGEIELVDASTREATNAIIRVQSKATTRPFPLETEHSFEWPCDQRDIDYWMSGNAPVILAVSRPRSDEAYWVSVKDYFNTPARRKSGRVRFDKRTMCFTPESAAALFALAVPKTIGVYSAPRPREERLFSNLLTVTGLPERLWQGETEFRRPGEVFAKLREVGIDAAWRLIQRSATERRRNIRACKC